MASYMTWRKSTRSGSNGGHCVEVAAAWRKSSRSTSNGGHCVEVADNIPDTIAVRDSKNPDGPRLRFTPTAWVAFIADTKTGQYDH